MTLPCGTRARYNAGCRCPDCTEANRRWSAYYAGRGPQPPKVCLVDTEPVVEQPRKDTSWMTEANCLGVDADLMFPSRGEDTREGKRVCAGCSVRDACLEFALTPPVERYGIYGGLSERERRRLRTKARRWVA